MSEKLNNLLNKLGAEVLSEDAKAQIIKQFEDLIAEKAQIHVKNAKEKLDAEHSQLLEKLLANIDADHAKKFKIAMEGLDKKYAKKLKVCQSKFNKCINEDAKLFKAKLTAGVSMFLEQALRDFIPTEMIAESVQAKQNEKMLNELRKVLGVDLAFANELTVNAFKKQRAQINESKAKAAKLSKKYSVLKEQVKKQNTALLMEKVYDKLNDADEKAFMKRRMAGKPMDYIKENFDYVLKLYRNEKDVIQEDVKETAKQKVLNEKVQKGGFIKQLPKQPRVIQEQADPIMQSYLSGLAE